MLQQVQFAALTMPCQTAFEIVQMQPGVLHFGLHSSATLAAQSAHSNLQQPSGWHPEIDEIACINLQSIITRPQPSSLALSMHLEQRVYGSSINHEAPIAAGQTIWAGPYPALQGW